MLEVLKCPLSLNDIIYELCGDNSLESVSLQSMESPVSLVPWAPKSLIDTTSTKTVHEHVPHQDVQNTKMSW